MSILPKKSIDILMTDTTLSERWHDGDYLNLPETMEELKKLEATKKDEGKARVELINPEFILEMGKGLGFGAEKYSDYNYIEGEGLDHSRLYASAMRHLLQSMQGIDMDEESGIDHLIAVAINCQMLYTLKQKGKGTPQTIWRDDNEE